jgi:bacteriorhodopsin
MNDLIYTTGIASFIIQIITTILDTYALYIPTPPQLYDIKGLLWIEYIVNFIEGIFYIWMIRNFSSVKNITIFRYYDWVITTPAMLFTYSMYVLIIKKIEENQQHNLLDSVYNEKYTLLAIILLNWTMLFFGYIGELGKMSVKLSTFLGFIPFIIMFYIIYENYAKYTSLGINTFIYFVSVWGLYGVAALMSYEVKNIMYNVLDLFAKNFFALFLAYVLINKYIPLSTF